MDFEIRRKTDFDFCIKLKDFMHLFNIYWVLFSKQKCDFSGNFAIFCNFSYYFFLAIFRRETLPALANETNSNGENFRFFETKSAIFAVYILFFSYFFTS